MAPVQLAGTIVVTTILKPYEARKDLGPIRRFLVFALLIFLAVIYGLLSVILPVSMLAIPAAPFLIVTGIILWLLPDVGGIAYDRLQKLFLPFLAFSLAWPAYVAFNIPGIPTVTPTRIFLFSAVTVFVLNYSMSKEMRDAVKDAVSVAPIYMRVFWGFWAALTFSIVFTDEPSESLNRLFNNVIYWLIMMFMVTLLATRAGFVYKVYQIILYSIVVVVLYSLYESYIERVPWLDYLPGFLAIDPEMLAVVSSPQYRPGSNVYRVRGPFLAALYFSEFLTMVFPFFVHFLATEKRFWRLMALVATTVGLLYLMYMTNARSAMVGMIIVLALYPFYRAVQALLNTRQSLMVTSVITSYPVVIVILALVIQFWPRAHVAVLGGNTTQGSSDARSDQWEMAIPKAMEAPFGYGLARGNVELGYFNRGGKGTVDSYYITILLDAGVLGLALFIACFLIPAWLAFDKFRKAKTPEEQLWAPLSLALVNFVIVKSVLSSENTISFAFIIVGCIIGLIWQQQRRDATAVTAASASNAISVAAAPPRRVVPAAGKVVHLPGRG